MTALQAFDVIVVGAGMAGLSAALGFSLKGFQVALIESAPLLESPLVDKDAPFSMKVVALTRASENFFEYLGVWSHILQARHCAYQHMKVWDNALDGLIEFWACDYFEPNLGYIVEQQNILSALIQKIHQSQSVTILMDSAVQMHDSANDHQKILELKSGLRLQAPLIIGADGAQSAIRKMANITITQSDYHQHAVVAVVKGEQPHGSTAFQRFADDGPLALLPLSHPKRSSIVWTTTPVQAQALCEMAVEDFNEKLTRESNAILGKMTLVGKRAAFPLKAQHAKQYAINGCVLVGDAAHTLHPLAGQGANLGLLDVASLIDVVASAKQKGRHYGALSVLARYERSRRTHNQAMIFAMDLFKRGFGSRANIIQRLRNSGLNWVNQQVGIKKIFAQLALGTLGPIPLLAKKT